VGLTVIDPMPHHAAYAKREISPLNWDPQPASRVKRETLALVLEIVNALNVNLDHTAPYQG
jgi:hypothetical protein